MKDNALGALMVFFMAIVALVLLDDLSHSREQDQPTELVNTELEKQTETDLATTDDFE
jgi:hypothetical protein